MGAFAGLGSAGFRGADPGRCARQGSRAHLPCSDEDSVRQWYMRRFLVVQLAARARGPITSFTPTLSSHVKKPNISVAASLQCTTTTGLGTSGEPNISVAASLWDVVSQVSLEPNAEDSIHWPAPPAPILSFLGLSAFLHGQNKIGFRF